MFAIKEEFEARNSGKDPKDWQADECWEFLTDPLEAAAGEVLSDWPDRRRSTTSSRSSPG